MTSYMKGRMSETRIMRLRGFEYRTAILWDDKERAERRIEAIERKLNHKGGDDGRTD